MSVEAAPAAAPTTTSASASAAATTPSRRPLSPPPPPPKPPGPVDTAQTPAIPVASMLHADGIGNRVAPIEEVPGDAGFDEDDVGPHAHNALNNIGKTVAGSGRNRVADDKRSRPPDGGWGWAVVAAAFFINMASDGISFSFGLLYIEFLRYFGQSRSKTSWVGSLFMAVPMLTGPLASAMVDRYGCRAMTILGGVVSGLGFVISAWADSIVQMYLTFGVLAGLGLGLCFITAVVSIAYWFERRRTLAMSLGAAGTGFGTFVYAPMTNYFISEFGWRGTVLLLAGTFFNLCVCGVVMRDPAWWRAEQARARQAADAAPPRDIVPLRPRPVGVSANSSPAPALHHSASAPLAQMGDGSAAAPLLPQRQRISQMAPPAVAVAVAVPTLPPPAVVLLRAESVPCFRRRVSLLSAPASLPTLSTQTAAPVPNNTTSRSSSDGGVLALLRAVVDFSLFLELHFLLMSAGTALLYTWFFVPYFYLADYMTGTGLYSKADASGLLCVIGITNTFGMVALGWVGDDPRVHAIKTYALCLLVCGLTTAAIPLIVHRHWLLIMVCAVFGGSFASTFSFTPTILAELVHMERFTVAYGLNLLCQGVGNLLGPPFAGWLYDKTGSWNLTFYMSGLNICIAAGLTALIAYTENRKLYLNCRKLQR